MGAVIGWSMYEIPGVMSISPWIFVREAIGKNYRTCNASNIRELIELCLSYFNNPDAYVHTRLYNQLNDAFPHLQEHIYKNTLTSIGSSYEYAIQR